jgi:hypothetical protein
MPKPTKTTKPKTGRPRAGRLKTLISFEAEQLADLRAEAFRRAATQLRGRPDVSGVVRSIVDEWRAKRRREK